MGRREVYAGFWWRFFRERDYLEDLGEVGRIISEWIFKKWDGTHGLEWVRMGTDAGFL
jgi:hypothetical protein